MPDSLPAEYLWNLKSGYLLMMALPPVPSMVAMAMTTLMTGKTILREESALLPRKREI